jgi:hypothetical protein
MRHSRPLAYVLALSICTCVVSAGQGPNVPHVQSKFDAASLDKVENTPPPGFIALFNGKDLTNWKGLLDPRKKLDNPAVRAKLSSEDRAKAQEEADQNMRQHWKPENGVLVFDGKGRNLCTEKLYGDFELWVDWKIEPGGDSGIYLRGSPQVQIWDPANKPAGGIGSGGLYNNQKHDHDPDVFADRPVGQWNRLHITMVGERVTVELNGNRVVNDVVLENYWDRSRPIFPAESIELQNHSSRLEFKNIYVREIK